MEIAWEKTEKFGDYSEIFQIKDFEKKIPYYYTDDTGKLVIKYKKGASKKLKDVKERLNLLGYDLKRVKKIFDEDIKFYEYYSKEKLEIRFQDYYLFLVNLDIAKIDNIVSSADYLDYDSNGIEELEKERYFTKCIKSDKEINKKFNEYLVKNNKEIEKISELIFFISGVDPYVTLRILAENPKNLNYDVEWRYRDLINDGKLKKEEIVSEISQHDKIWIITEGTSDSFIIKKAINELYPEIADFFEFIDMHENYPFTGAGSLSNFVMGLSKICIENNMIVIFDNDTEGNELYNKVKRINKIPENLVICKLPELKEFNKIQTVGPNGVKINNINGKAISIECFLDFKSVNHEPIVRWECYKKDMHQYQGALEGKDEYTKKLKKVKFNDRGYDSAKMRKLIEYIINCWINRNKNTL